MKVNQDGPPVTGSRSSVGAGIYEGVSCWSWFGFVRFALLLAVVLCWVARCFGSWVLLAFFCLHRVTYATSTTSTCMRHDIRHLRSCTYM